MTRNRNTLILLFVLIGAVTISPLLWWRPLTGFTHGMVGMMGYGWGLVPFISTAFLLLITLGVYYFVTEFARTPSNNERPLEILRERYAKGEIATKQYLRMKEELKS